MILLVGLPAPMVNFPSQIMVSKKDAPFYRRRLRRIIAAPLALCHALWGMIGRKFRRELHLMIDFVASANRLPKSTPRGPKVLDFRLLEGPGSSTALQAAQKGQRIKLVKPLGSPSWPQVGFQVRPSWAKNRHLTSFKFRQHF